MCPKQNQLKHFRSGILFHQHTVDGKNPKQPGMYQTRRKKMVDKHG